jgi:SH3-like domain-containing protein
VTPVHLRQKAPLNIALDELLDNNRIRLAYDGQCKNIYQPCLTGRRSAMTFTTRKKAVFLIPELAVFSTLLFWKIKPRSQKGARVEKNLKNGIFR